MTLATEIQILQFVPTRQNAREHSLELLLMHDMLI